MSEAKMSMKLLVDNTKHKVLFAEAGKDCVDLLLHFLSLPLSTVVHLVTEKSMVGSIGNLYGSFENLSTDYLQDGINRLSLIDPSPKKIGFMDLELPDSDPDDPDYVPDDHDSDSEYEYTESESDDPDSEGMFGGGYVNRLGDVSYIVMDDLCVKPMSWVSAVTLLNKFDVQDVGQLEERVVTVDTKLAVALLKASLKSKTVLTDVFIHGRD